MSQTLSCKSCDRAIEGAALACGGCGALHHEGCHRTAGHCAACASAKGAVAVSVGGRDRSRAAALLAASLALSALVMGVALVRPAREPEPAGLEVPKRADYLRVAGTYHGAISGNDPSVIAELDLRQDGYDLEGELRWSSKRSGKNTRTVRGHLVPERGLVILRDVGMPVAEASSGWRFCPVEHYLLDVKDGQLAGRYWSSECNDQAGVYLRRIR